MGNSVQPQKQVSGDGAFSAEHQERTAFDARQSRNNLGQMRSHLAQRCAVFSASFWRSLHSLLIYIVCTILRCYFSYVQCVFSPPFSLLPSRWIFFFLFFSVLLLLFFPGERLPLTQEHRASIEDNLLKMAAMARHCTAFCSQELDVEKVHQQH